MSARELTPQWASFGVCLGEAIRRRRETLGQSQLECALPLGYQQSWWSRLEDDASKCTIDTFLQLSVHVLHSTPVELLETAGRITLQRMRALEAQKESMS